jgi:hypothetical protein
VAIRDNLGNGRCVMDDGRLVHFFPTPPIPQNTGNITDEDLRKVKHFWEQKGSLESWSGYESKLPALLREHPELVRAQAELIAARKRMDAVVKSLCGSL